MKNRFKPVPDYTPKGKPAEKEVTLSFTPCLVCGKQIVEGFYARYANGGVCSKACNAIQSEKPKDFGERDEKTLVHSFNGGIFRPS